MDSETDQQRIEPEIAEYPEAGPFWVGLWAVARHWVGLLEQVFEPELIATTGITRSFALRCSKWLWSIEGLVRRLIIAAAMKLDVSQLPRLITGKPKPPRAQTPAAHRVVFTVLPRIPGRQPGAATSTHAATAAEHRHLAFSGDTLLHLFPRHDRRNARPAFVRTPNPLHRRGRRNRWDPDYTGSATCVMNHGPQFRPLDHRPWPEPRPRTRADRSSPYWKPPGGDLPEWKRIEFEWDRVIPSPRLAGRIRAILRVMQAPERWVERTARRLDAGPDLRDAIRAAPPPRFRKHRLDRGASPLLEVELAQAHAFDDSS